MSAPRMRVINNATTTAIGEMVELAYAVPWVSQFDVSFVLTKRSGTELCLETTLYDTSGRRYVEAFDLGFFPLFEALEQAKAKLEQRLAAGPSAPEGR